MTTEQRAEPIRWSGDGMVCYFDGLAWGLRGCLGKAEEVMKAHPLVGQRRKPLELKYGRKDRFSKSGISTRGR